MPFDVVAFYESQAAAALTPVAAVADQKYKINGDDLMVKARAPFLMGSLCAAVSQATLKYYEFRQPDLKVPYRFYKGADINDVFVAEGFNNLLSSPLPLYPDEKLNALVQNATNEVDLIVAFLSSGRMPLSAIEAVTPTHAITGYSDTTVTAGEWTAVPMTWDQDLPKGRYAVVGMQVGSYIAAGYAGGAARLNLLESDWRPGVIIRNAEADKLGVHSISPAIMYCERWPLMPEISFNHDQTPDLEICAGAALTDHVVELLLQKIA